ncbi:hypothetical protein BDN70DRAFT_876302 [Pholiota conissans]|uniref:F-box domain-containing protein n=1 Tax=Pholiota conissans TaxID=109636 RepID=A0A9P5Z4Z5_9AGAR|nr:hypothetical protein BDN70DRAFT_876302 [Pholiota conissans]
MRLRRRQQPLSIESNAQGPITNLPYDVLREIFIHCRPQFPLWQPFPEEAPLLLCRICSSWRRVALTIPSLWMHFACCITTQEVNDGTGARWGVLKTHVEVVRFWKKNHGSIPPYISIVVRYNHIRHREPAFPEHLLDMNGLDFILTYLMSAQHLDASMFIWERFRERLDTGAHVSFPNLHTVVGGQEYNWPSNPFYTTQLLLGQASKNAPSPLRRLRLEESVYPNINVIPNHWSTLTHISMTDMSIPHDFWFSLIRSVPELQWGSFRIDQMFSIDEEEMEYTEPTIQCTLPRLGTFHLDYYEQEECILEDHPISFLFTGLRLPALRTLGLSANHSKSWRNSDVITEVSTILKSTPSVTTLFLGPSFLSFTETDSFNLEDISPQKIEPFWKVAPRLRHIQLELVGSQSTGGPWAIQNAEELNSLVQNALLSDEGWLDLSNPNCPITTITIFTNSFQCTDEYTKTYRRKLAKKNPCARLSVVSEFYSPNDAAEKEWEAWGRFNH